MAGFTGFTFSVSLAFFGSAEFRARGVDMPPPTRGQCAQVLELRDFGVRVSQGWSSLGSLAFGV